MSRFDWCETSKGQWERNLDEAEIFYTSLQKRYEGTGRKFFAITGHLSIELEDSQSSSRSDDESKLDDSLRQAWLRLRHSHPTIAASTEFDTENDCLKKIYQSSGYEAWSNDTFQTVAIQTDSSDWCNQDPPAPDRATLFNLVPPFENGRIRRSIVLRSPHDIVDGIGTLQLLGIYISYVAENVGGQTAIQSLSWGDEYQRLSPPLRIAANLPEQVRSDILAAYEKLKVANAAIASSELPPTRVPCPRVADTPSEHQRTALRLSEKRTTAVIQACKSRSVSVTHAYHAAAALVLAGMQSRLDHDQQMQYVTYALINLRGQCSPKYSDSANAVSVYHCVSAQHLAIPFTIPKKDSSTTTDSSDFDRVLLDMKAYYEANRPSTEPMLLQLSSLLWQQSTPDIPIDAWSSSQPMAIPGPNPNPSISMSSFGVVDKLISSQAGRLIVRDPWVTGEELGNGIGLFLGTFRGELEISAAFNAAWHNLEEIQEYLVRIQAIVDSGFGIEEE